MQKLWISFVCQKILYYGRMRQLSDKVYFENAYFIIGTAYAGKSTMVKELAKRHSGIACEENYHDNYPEGMVG